MDRLQIMLERHSNGGWTITEAPREHGLIGMDLGAYSSDREMLDALNGELVRRSNESRTKEQDK